MEFQEQPREHEYPAVAPHEIIPQSENTIAPIYIGRTMLSPELRDRADDTGKPNDANETSDRVIRPESELRTMIHKMEGAAQTAITKKLEAPMGLYIPSGTNKYGQEIDRLRKTQDWTQITVPEFEEIAPLLHRIAESFDVPAEGLNIAGNLKHEGQHVQGFRQIGFTDIIGGIHVRCRPFPEDPEVNEVEYYPFVYASPQKGAYMSPLTSAAVDIYPVDPSEGDIANIHKRGYTDKYDVLDALLQYNSIGDDEQLPLPLWYDPNNKR
jgi:hypothetical protein